MLNSIWIYQIFRKKLLIFHSSYIIYLFIVLLINWLIFVLSSNLRDPYLIKLEQMLRAFCLKLTVCDSLLNSLPPNCTFQIHIHTTETGSIEIQKDTEVSV